MEKKMTRGMIPAPSSRSFAGPAHLPLFQAATPVPRLRLDPASDRDVGDEQAREQEPGEHAGEPELADGLPGDHAIEDENDARRDQNAERAARLDDSRDHDLVVAAPQQLRQSDRGADRHAGHAQPVHGRDHDHQADGADGQTAADRAGPDVEHPVEVFRDAGFGQHVPHVDEHRQGHERIPVQQDEARVERHLEAALAPQHQGESRGHEADRAEHPLPGEQQEQHRGEHQERDELVAHASGSPLAFATSLKNTAITCSSISAMPMHMMILIGARGGAQEE